MDKARLNMDTSRASARRTTERARQERRFGFSDGSKQFAKKTSQGRESVLNAVHVRVAVEKSPKVHRPRQPVPSHRTPGTASL